MRSIEVLNPRTGRADHVLAAVSTEALAARCAELRAAQPAWEALGIEGRTDAMRALCTAVRRHRQPILDALTADTGRVPMSEAEIEGLIGITEMRCATAAQAMAEAIGASSDASLGYRQQYVPFTLVGIISPWNYPLILSMIDAIPALLAGCAVAVKPSEVTPRFIAPFRAAIAEVPVLRDVLEYFEGGAETGEAVIGATDMVVFTGSVATGRKVQERATRQFKPAFLELGGSDPAIVLASADPDRAAEIIVRGSVENAGQLCCAIERVYVAREILPAVRSRVLERMQALTLNTADPAQGDLGPIIHRPQADVLRAQIADALDKGATLLAGGEVIEHKGGLWCQPTVLDGVTHEMAVIRDETFGPIVPLMAFDSVDEAVRLANDTAFGLSAAVIGDEDEAVAVARRINAGGLWINDFDTMGGVGATAEKTAFGVSGLGGSRYGFGGFMRFLRKKAIVVRRSAA